MKSQITFWISPPPCMSKATDLEKDGYSGADENEKEASKTCVVILFIFFSPKPKVHFWTMMKYATIHETLLMIVGIIMSCGVGSSMPVTFLIFSDLVNDLLGTDGNFSFQPIIENIAIIGAATFAAGFIQMFCLQTNAKLQARRIRLLLYRVCSHL